MEKQEFEKRLGVLCQILGKEILEDGYTRKADAIDYYTIMGNMDPKQCYLKGRQYPEAKKAFNKNAKFMQKLLDDEPLTEDKCEIKYSYYKGDNWEDIVEISLEENVDAIYYLEKHNLPITNFTFLSRIRRLADEKYYATKSNKKLIK